ncbi:cupin domain-containing protein [Paraburkholderia madseniana]|uniref:cupin domain-containing protein n=1 Tax=Paraburkholderia madseniana TaxID=2599607 RepID=UPI0015C558C6|nr:cupin domain-containing protein [Paraburkholderia madseniana]NPT67065.1 cupin domain-containing protein [Paraburkholderia madseniana]
MHYEQQIEQGRYEAFTLAPRDWVPNNRKLAVAIYHTALPAASSDLAAEFEALFEHNQWPPQWRNSIFDYHHFHSTAHEVLGIASGSAQVIVGGPGGRMVTVEAGDALLLPAGTGHCLQSFDGYLNVIGAYPAGQQWDIRRSALTPQELAAMDKLPFPASDPVLGERGPVIEQWLGVD